MHICCLGNGTTLNKVIRGIKVLGKSHRPYPKGAVCSWDVRFIVYYVSGSRVPINRFPVSGQSRKRIWLICQADFTPVYITVIHAAGRKGVRTVIPPGANRQTLTIGNRFLPAARAAPGRPGKKFNGQEKIALTIPAARRRRRLFPAKGVRRRSTARSDANYSTKKKEGREQVKDIIIGPEQFWAMPLDILEPRQEARKV